MVKKICAVVVATCCVASAETLIDFARSAESRWGIVFGGAKDPTARARQIGYSDAGMRVSIDRRTMGRACAWCTLAQPRGHKAEIPVGAEVHFFCRIPAGSIIRKPGSLTVVDREGEIFRFTPEDLRTIDGRTEAVFRIREGGQAGAFVAGRPSKGATLGTNRNERLDAPLRLNSLSFEFHADRDAGDVLLERLEASVAVAPTLTCERPVWTFDAARDEFRLGMTNAPIWREGCPALCTTNRCITLRYANFPGMKPVPGMSELVVRTTHAYAGGMVTADLIEPATGKRHHFKAPWKEEMRFKTDLPHGRSYQLSPLQFWVPKPKVTCADFTVQSVTGVFRETAAEAVFAELDTGNFLHVSRGPHEPPRIVLTNTAPRAVAVTGVFRARDWYGQGPDVRIDARLAPGARREFPIPGANAKGIWRVCGTVKADDGSEREHELRFAVLDAHAVTPRWPRGRHFRMGLNYHAARFCPGDLERTMDALAAIGCKFVRLGGFHFNQCEPAPGVFDWTKADRIMAAGEKRGISFDAGFYTPPSWSVDRVARDKIDHRKKAQFPPNPGLLRDYAEALARRYGTKIDYYELGNEWDLVPDFVLPEADAIRLQKEAWEGVKKGCAEAKVMPNGWTSDMTFDRPGMNRKGFQERYMAATKGFYDFHPVHTHGTFPRYVKSTERFLAQRKALGIDGVPWFSNETALSSVNGNEDVVARTVWKKILYAWAMGSVDYIWYNLKATGWVPSDAEQAYGVISADFQPRAGYAALSALIAALQGLDFDHPLHVEKTRWTYCFAGHREDGFAGIAFAGWDEAAPKRGCAIRVRTDARAAVRVDLMGNRVPVKVRDGVATWTLRADPSALLLEGATRADAVSDDLRAIRDPPGARIDVPAGAMEGRPADIVLERADQMHGVYDADPANVDRTWKGPKDLSARIWLRKTDRGLAVKASVTDDREAAGDDVKLFVRLPGEREVREISLRNVPDGKRTTASGVDYAAVLPFPEDALRAGFDLTVHVLDDDGRGVDGWMQLTTETEPPRSVRLLDD